MTKGKPIFLAITVTCLLMMSTVILTAWTDTCPQWPAFSGSNIQADDIPESQNLALSLWQHPWASACGDGVDIGILYGGTIPALTAEEASRIEVVADAPTLIRQSDPYFSNAMEILQRTAPLARFTVYAMSEPTADDFQAGAKHLVQTESVDLLLNWIANPTFNDPSLTLVDKSSPLKTTVLEMTDVLWVHNAGMYGLSYVEGRLTADDVGVPYQFGSSNSLQITRIAPLVNIPGRWPYRISLLLNHAPTSNGVELSFFQGNTYLTSCQIPSTVTLINISPLADLPECSNPQPINTMFLETADTIHIQLQAVGAGDVSFEIFARNSLLSFYSTDHSIPIPNNTEGSHTITVGIDGKYSKTALRSSVKIETDPNNFTIRADEALYATAYVGGIAALYIADDKLKTPDPEDQAEHRTARVARVKRIITALDGQNQTLLVQEPPRLNTAISLLIFTIACITLILLDLAMKRESWWRSIRHIFAFCFAGIFIFLLAIRHSSSPPPLVYIGIAFIVILGVRLAQAEIFLNELVDVLEKLPEWPLKGALIAALKITHRILVSTNTKQISVADNTSEKKVDNS